VKVGLHAVGKRTTSAHFGVIECAVRPCCDGSDVKWPLRYRYGLANSQWRTERGGLGCSNPPPLPEILKISVESSIA